jgi:hypothetical protein
VKTDCSHIQELLHNALDGELGEGTVDGARLHAHLAACAACREAFVALERTRAALQCWEAPAVNPQVSVAFAARVAERTAKPSPWAHLVRLRRALAWGAVVILVGVSVSLVPPATREASAPLPPVTTAARIPGLPEEAQEAKALSPTPAPPRQSDEQPRTVLNRLTSPRVERRIPSPPFPRREVPPPSLPDATLVAVGLLTEALPDAAVSEAPPLVLADADAATSIASSPELAVLAAWTEAE